MNEFPDTQAAQTSMGNQFVSGEPTVGLPWRLMIFSIILFGFFIFLYAGIKFGYESYLSSQKDAVTADTKKLAKEINADDQNQFINFYSQVFNLKKVFADHMFAANVFKFFENKVASGVYFTDAVYNKANMRVDADGVATSNATLVQQLAALDASPEVDQAVLTQTKYDAAGRVLFGVRITFKNSFLTQPQ